MHGLPGYQTFNGRLWQVRALLQADCGNLLAQRSIGASCALIAARRLAVFRSAIDMQR